MGDVTFLQQAEPVDEYGRALYAAARSILRAHLDQLGPEDLTDLNCDRADVTLRQLSKVVRLDRDKGLRGDGFEWAVHEAILGGEPTVTELVSDAMRRTSPKFKYMGNPTSLLFGYERARYLGFLDAIVTDAGRDALLLPDGQGRPFYFAKSVPIAAQGEAGEEQLGKRIRKVWKTDLFLSADTSWRYVAATIKSNYRQLEEGPGLRVGIVPEAPDLPAGVRRRGGLWLAVLRDPNGFMGIFNDAYWSVAAAVYTLGKQAKPPYYLKPSAKGRALQAQLEKFGLATVLDIDHALNEAAQQNLIAKRHTLLSVAAPDWLHMTERKTPVVAVKPSFVPLD